MISNGRTRCNSTSLWKLIFYEEARNIKWKKRNAEMHLQKMFVLLTEHDQKKMCLVLLFEKFCFLFCFEAGYPVSKSMFEVPE